MARIPASEWRPIGIDDLERNAWDGLRSMGSTIVVAGPGSGKTEFLAQRAAYLLETGECPSPRRILAISFKKDAAANLAARVAVRCSPEQARRFVSLTFDAFTKSLVDRFRTAIPEAWRPTTPYSLDLLKTDEIQEILTGALNEAPAKLQPSIGGLNARTFESRNVGTHRIDIGRTDSINGTEFAIEYYWKKLLHQSTPSSLSFVGLNRLAELMIRSNHHVRRALRGTYPFVFVDEFQDTSYAQYDFLHSAFCNNRAVVTAVGDSKQKIMAWAGALPDAFSRFVEDFGASTIVLRFNFRSSPDLVRIQHVVARAIDAGVVVAEAQTSPLVDGDAAQVWVSRTVDTEAEHLAQWISADMAARDLRPRNYALLVRQKADNVEADLRAHFAGTDLRIRNESRSLGRMTLQDLLADELSMIALSILRLAATKRDPGSWIRAAQAVELLRANDPDDERSCRIAENELSAFVATIRVIMEKSAPDRNLAAKLTQQVFEFLDFAHVARAFPAYRQSDAFEILIEAFSAHLGACALVHANWSSSLDSFEGLDQIPLMTVHKSKGLEFDTIVFIGLDDRSWWSYTPQNPEGLSTFFVALSRAEQRAIFSFCPERGDRSKIDALYTLLRSAGVPEIRIESTSS